MAGLPSGGLRELRPEAESPGSGATTLRPRPARSRSGRRSRKPNNRGRAQGRWRWPAPSWDGGCVREGQLARFNPSSRSMRPISRRYGAAVGDDAGGTPSITSVNRTQKVQVTAMMLPAVETQKSVMLRRAANPAATVARESMKGEVYERGGPGGSGGSATSRDSPNTR